MTQPLTTLLVVGATGMLGNSVLRFFANSPGFRVWGSARTPSLLRYMPSELHSRIVTGIDANSTDSLQRLFLDTRPDIVINCIGLVKQLPEADDPLCAIPINTILPHRLAQICALIGARLIHVSTDCVFSGITGNYQEDDIPDATDLYGRTKLIGELYYPHSITLRTSIIGHELCSSKSLINWFLSQSGEVKGYTNAVFSGLTTVEFARIVRDYVLPNADLHGLYHVSSEPISKYDLLRLVGQEYASSAVLVPTNLPVINRSLDSSRFRKATGYIPPEWPDLIRSMRFHSLP